MEVRSYRKKPVVVQAIQIETIGKGGKNVPDAVKQFLKGTPWFISKDGTAYALMIPTREGNMAADEGDWIIKGIAGEFYPCKPDIFAQTYELVE